jgi:hypothetical protein
MEVRPLWIASLSHIKPRIGQTVKDVILNGNDCHLGVSVEELMLFLYVGRMKQ